MISPLGKISLEALFKQPVMFDANIFMVGIENRPSDPNCAFENIKKLFLIPVFESFSNIIIHEKVYGELDEETKKFIDTYQNPKVQIVTENGLYGTDPLYTVIFNAIADHERVKYTRGHSKNQGEVYSLAYAAYNKISYFSSKEIMVDLLAKDLPELRDVEIITFDVIVLLSYLYYMKRKDVSNNKAFKSVYKRFCEDVIKRHRLPGTLSEYVKESIPYIG